MKVLECLAKVVIPNPKKSKIGLRNIVYVIIRYPKNNIVNHSFVFKFDDPDIHENTNIESRNASFV